jgi:hypothetical protein
MTSKLDILGSDKRCLWYMDLHYGASHKTRNNYKICRECKGYDTKCHLYTPFVQVDFTAVDNWVRQNIEKKRAKTLDNKVRI